MHTTQIHSEPNEWLLLELAGLIRLRDQGTITTDTAASLAITAGKTAEAFRRELRAQKRQEPRS